VAAEHSLETCLLNNRVGCRVKPLPTESAEYVIGFAGMTHLGLVSSSVVASRGFETVCYDQSGDLVGRLQRGDLPVSEPQLDAIIAGNGTRQIFTSALEGLGQCDIVYVAPDVPTDDQGRSDLSGIVTLINDVAKVLRPGSLLVVLCQVPPGFTRKISSIDHRYLYYQVETLVFGIAVQRAAEPERYIIGCASPEKPIDPRLAAFLEVAGCPILPMRYESAELAKIAINCCLVASISVANTLAELCEAIGADWREIVPSLKLDARIGPKSYLAPGLGIAGGNLERDLATIVSLAGKHGTNSDVVRAWISNSQHRKGWAARTMEQALFKDKPDATVSVWGLAYKENTASIKNSPSLATLADLQGRRFVVHDPLVRSHEFAQVQDPLEALDGADALMILTPWDAYRRVSVSDIARRLRGRLVLDPYGVLDRRAVVACQLDYRTLGLSPTTLETGR
jgi:UDPglucose 6-dehydrogenase